MHFINNGDICINIGDIYINKGDICTNIAVIYKMRLTKAKALPTSER